MYLAAGDIRNSGREFPGIPIPQISGTDGCASGDSSAVSGIGPVRGQVHPGYPEAEQREEQPDRSGETGGRS